MNALSESSGVVLFTKKQQGEPGDYIFAVLKFQTLLRNEPQQVDAVAFHAGVHLLREPAGLTV